MKIPDEVSFSLLQIGSFFFLHFVGRMWNWLREKEVIWGEGTIEGLWWKWLPQGPILNWENYLKCADIHMYLLHRSEVSKERVEVFPIPKPLGYRKFFNTQPSNWGFESKRHRPQGFKKNSPTSFMNRLKVLIQVEFNLLPTKSWKIS